MDSTDRTIKTHAFIEHIIAQISGLSLEQRDDLDALVSILINEERAKGLLPQRLLLSFAIASQQEARVHSYSTGSTTNSLLAAATNVLSKLDPSEPAEAVAAAAAQNCTNAAFRRTTEDRLEKAGYLRNAIELEAERIAMDVTQASAGLMLSAARRQHLALKALKILHDRRKS